MNFEKIKINHVTADKQFVVVGANPNVSFLVGAREYDVIRFRKQLSGYLPAAALEFYISVKYITPENDPEYFI